MKQTLWIIHLYDAEFLPVDSSKPDTLERIGDSVNEKDTCILACLDCDFPGKNTPWLCKMYHAPKCVCWAEEAAGKSAIKCNYMLTKLVEEELVNFSPCATLYLKLCKAARSSVPRQKQKRNDLVTHLVEIRSGFLITGGGWAKHCISLHSACPLRGFQSQFERQWASLSVTTQSPLGSMLAESISLLEWVPRILCAATPVICICHLLFSLTLLLPLCLLESLGWHLISLPFCFCLLSVSSLPPFCGSCPSTILSLSMETKALLF